MVGEGREDSEGDVALVGGGAEHTEFPDCKGCEGSEYDVAMDGGGAEQTDR